MTINSSELLTYVKDRFDLEALYERCVAEEAVIKGGNINKARVEGLISPREYISLYNIYFDGREIVLNDGKEKNIKIVATKKTGK